MVSHHRRLHWAKRQQAVEDLIQNKLNVFHGEIKQLLLAIESPQDAEDFILFIFAAFLASLDQETQRA